MTRIDPPGTAVRRTPAGSIVMLIIGSLLALLGFALVAGGIAAASVAAAQRDGGFFTSPATLFSTDAYALTTPRSTEFSGADRRGDLPFDIGQIRLRAEGDQPLFVGIATRGDVDRFLAGVRHTEVTGVDYNPFRADYRDIPGTAIPAEPGQQTFWVESASGSGPQELTWTIEPGNWVVVVMNQDGSAGVSATIDAGFRSDLLAPIALGVLGTGILLFLIAIPLVLFGAAGIGRSLTPAPQGLTAGEYVGSGGDPDARPSPVRLVGRRDETLSRWLWLVKWLLAIPHYLILAFLWTAFLVSTIAAGFAILFTGRYPRSLFEFNVGVLRWNWRVGFYAYSALGTDRYPPFSLARADYPAELDIAYPARLTNGLVLVKWWLLAIPHYLVLAALTGGLAILPTLWPDFRPFGSVSSATTSLSVLGALVLIAGGFLLFVGRYPRGLFGLVVGIDRWVYRVVAYAALMRDEYPPFRLDQGPDEPAPTPLPTGPREDSALR